ncbi:hypothetical protein GUI12_01035 [Anaplasmataceae bacterium AB001_6]|nr:hypothetical protein GUI12_01035 [Anaplasmataceae bacterium AB001_6]
MLGLKKVNLIFLAVVISCMLGAAFGTKYVMDLYDSKKGPFFYSVKIFDVNLDQGKELLQIKISIELDNMLDLKAIKKFDPYIRDMCLKYFTALRPADLHGSNALYIMREELMLRLNKAVQPTVVKNILFEEIMTG